MGEGMLLFLLLIAGVVTVVVVSPLWVMIARLLGVDI